MEVYKFYIDDLRIYGLVNLDFDSKRFEFSNVPQGDSVQALYIKAQDRNIVAIKFHRDGVPYSVDGVIEMIEVKSLDTMSMVITLCSEIKALTEY